MTTVFVLMLKRKNIVFVDNNAVLKLKFQQLHKTVVNSGSAAGIIDFLFEKRVLGDDDMYRSAIR